MNIGASANVLMNFSGSSDKYIQRMDQYDKKEARLSVEEKPRARIEQKTLTSDEVDESLAANPVYEAVLHGDKTNIIAFAEKELQGGKKAEDIIDGLLIPAITRVGDLYDQQRYFLPQLISGANLEPKIEKSSDNAVLPTIVVATVEGDVHDIGKNLVALMLRNYGYTVIDLGKDVPAADIIEKALEVHAAVVGLSALMTTTMMHMKDVIAEAAKRLYTGKIIIGGAAVTSSFADEIGADGYSKDAADCVRLVKSLL